MKRMKLLFTLALPVVLLQNVQAQSSRLISQAHWYNNGTIFVPKDTTKYSYTNPRGGDLMNTLKFDNAYKWLSADTSLINDSLITQDFYSDNSIKSSTVQVWDATSGMWINKSRQNYWYNGDGTMDYSIFQTWGGASWTNISKNDYTYGSGKLVRNEFQTWNGVTFTAATAMIYSYDAAGNISQVLSQSNESGFWVYTKNIEYTYTGASNWLASTKYGNWNGTSFTPDYQYSNTYDTAGNRLTMVYQTWNSATATWINNRLSVYSNFTSARMAQTQIDQTWDSTGGGSWNNDKLYTYTYNGSNQMTSMVAISWNIAGFWQYVLGDGLARYHYEDYTVGVANVNATEGNLTVSPVPAQNVINLSLNWKNAQPFSVGIYSINGALVAYYNVAATAQYNATIPVDGLANGNYIVKVSGNNGQITQQFSVAH